MTAIAVAVACETAPGERRVAATPETCKKLIALGAQVRVQRGAGLNAGFTDEAYAAVGAQLADDAARTYADADLVLCVQPPDPATLTQLKEGAALVGMLAPEGDSARAEAIVARKLAAFPLERLPRTTRAQAMDILSSQAGMAGYKATLIAAQLAPRFFPMLTTAAGTIRPSKVLIVGAGVAGLQAGGYARQLTDEERALQQQKLADHLKNIDVIVCTAAVPGRPAPKIITAAMVAGMKPGSVVVDLAAETGGNCELTQPGDTIDRGGVTIAGPLNLASMGAVHASEMYARNLLNFVSLFVKDGAIVFDWSDELLAKTVWPRRDDTSDSIVPNAPQRAG
jgi:NAD(P) transhydrogenase subunit alpha